MSSNEELSRFFTNVEHFLRQQEEIYGETILVKPGRAVERTAEPVTRETVPAPAKPAIEEPELFGPEKPAARKPPVSAKTVEPASYPAEAWTGAETVDSLNAQICTCQKCGLGKTRKNFVFGVGNPQAKVVVVGEAPGADEDAQGEPFVGRAGQLLNKILEAVQFKREEVFICNILKCRPPENRRPAPEEVELCEPYLWKQLELIKPRMILALGLTAAQSLLKTTASLGQMRGKFFDYRGIKLMVTYHPAALLRNPNWKRPTWEDVQLFRKTYDELEASSLPNR
jgi:uracil-DNA glycosylase family 4